MKKPVVLCAALAILFFQAVSVSSGVSAVGALNPSSMQDSPNPPQIIQVRDRVELTTRILRKRLDTLLPLTLREAGLDMWLVICQEDNLDPVYKTMIPMDTWPKVLQILVFYDRGKEAGVERINLSMTNTAGLYDRPWKGGNFPEQWRLLSEIVEKRDPKRIGINIGALSWAAGGLTKNLYDQLVRSLPAKYVERLTSAEAACVRWAMTLTEDELDVYRHVSSIARRLIARCFHPSSVRPGITTLQDLEWMFWQMCSESGLEQSFKPYFLLLRSDSESKKNPDSDGLIRGGDVLVCDVGIKYLGLFTDHQEVAYVRRADETDAPPGLRNLLAANNRLQNIFMREFKKGLTGNRVLTNVLSSAREAGIPSAMIYSHSIGLFVHEPGPVIGLPWDQKPFPGRGDVRLEYNSCYAMELSVEEIVPEWDNQRVWCPTEQIVQFTEKGCQPLDGVQTRFHLI